MSALLIRCPVTGQDAELGIEVDPTSYLTMPLDTPLACPLCGGMHSWENAIPPRDAIELALRLLNGTPARRIEPPL